jgi:hypothetical protein
MRQVGGRFWSPNCPISVVACRELESLDAGTLDSAFEIALGAVFVHDDRHLVLHHLVGFAALGRGRAPSRCEALGSAGHRASI